MGGFSVVEDDDSSLPLVADEGAFAVVLADGPLLQFSATVRLPRLVPANHSACGYNRPCAHQILG